MAQNGTLPVEHGEESPDLRTDRRHLVTAAYGTGQNLAARQNIYQYQQRPGSLFEWALEQAPIAQARTILDVGCGNGQYLAHMARLPGTRRLLGFDLSRGMLEGIARSWDAALPRPLLAAADAQSLPLPDSCCDVALAMHMLYHVPDMVRAARELRRVLRPGGVLLAATNSERDKLELWDVYTAALRMAGGSGVESHAGISIPFMLESGAAVLREAFTHVEARYMPEGELQIPDVAPVVSYMDSARSFRERSLPAGVTWNAVMAALDTIVAQRISEDGAFRVRTSAGLFVCS